MENSSKRSKTHYKSINLTHTPVSVLALNPKPPSIKTTLLTNSRPQ